MGNNEVSSAVDVLINVMILSIIIVVAMGTVAVGNMLKEQSVSKVDEILSSAGDSYEDIETLLTYPHEIPMATVFQVVKNNEGHINDVDLYYLHPTVPVLPSGAYNHVLDSNVTETDYTSRFDTKVVIVGSKLANGTFNLQLQEVY